MFFVIAGLIFVIAGPVIVIAGLDPAIFFHFFKLFYMELGTIEQIAQGTGLTVEEVQKLAETMKA